MANTVRKYFKVEGQEVEFETNVFPTWLNLFCELQQQYPGKDVECGWVYDDGSTMTMHRTAPKVTKDLSHLPPVSDEYRTGVCDEPGDMNSFYDDYVAEKHAARNELMS